MSLPTVKGCCCLSLRTAGLIMGIIGVTADVLTLVVYAFYNEKYQQPGEIPEGIWELTLAFICVVFSASWIYGIIREKTGPMLPFLIVSFFAAMLFIFAPFISLFYFSYTNADAMYGTITFFLLCYIAGLAGFTWVVQYSLYKQMEELSIEKDEDRNGV